MKIDTEMMPSNQAAKRLMGTQIPTAHYRINCFRDKVKNDCVRLWGGGTELKIYLPGERIFRIEGREMGEP